MRSRSLSLLFCLLALFAAGCSEDKPTGFEPQVSNVPGSFRFTATGITATSNTLTYTWQNPGPTADISQACQVTAGTATLTVWDAGATQVYTRDLADSGNFTTDPGTPGVWTIDVILLGMSGAIEFTAQTP